MCLWQQAWRQTDCLVSENSWPCSFIYLSFVPAHNNASSNMNIQHQWAYRAQLCTISDADWHVAGIFMSFFSHHFGTVERLLGFCPCSFVLTVWQNCVFVMCRSPLVWWGLLSSKRAACKTCKALAVELHCVILRNLTALTTLTVCMH